MRIFEENLADVRILRLMGEVDATDVPVLTAWLARPGPSRVVVNLKDVTFATAAAVGSLVEARAELRRRAGDLAVSAPSEPVARLVHTLGLDLVLPRHRGDGDAVRHLRADAEAAHAPYAA